MYTPLTIRDATVRLRPHQHAWPGLGNRLTVDPQTLTLLVLVRIQVPQPIIL